MLVLIRQIHLIVDYLYFQYVQQESLLKVILQYIIQTLQKYNINKTFIIDHPKDEKKYLVHACLEGPEEGVYYRGKGEITDNISTTIYLPDYVDKIATNLRVELTPIYSDNIKVYNIAASRVKDNKFEVYGNNCEFFWTVYGTRLNINVEPTKNNTIMNGNGPYKWIPNN